MMLCDLKIGEKAKITAINLNYKKKKRLIDLGLDVGVEIQKIRNAPLLSPIEFKVMNFFLSIRKNVAKKIMVVKIYDK